MGNRCFRFSTGGRPFQVPPLATKLPTPPSAGQKFPAKSPTALFIPGRDNKRLGCLICPTKHDGIISRPNQTYIIIRPLRYRKEIIPAVGHAKIKHRTIARILWGSGGRAGLQAACQLTCGFAWFVVSKCSQELLSRRCGVWRCGPPATRGLGDGDGDCGDCD